VSLDERWTVTSMRILRGVPWNEHRLGEWP
jgi:hypothetical protein